MKAVHPLSRREWVHGRQVKALALTVASLLCIVFSRFPLRRRRVVFVSYPDGTDNAFAMFEHIRSLDTGLDLVWVVDRPTAELKAKLAGSRLVKRASVRRYYDVSTAGLIFHTHGLSRVLRERAGQFVFNLWHGMPLKTIGTYDGLDTRLPRTTWTLATSPLFQVVMATALAVPPERVLLVGQPRNDRMLRHAAKGEPDIALWMPTYRRSIEGKIRTDSLLSPADEERIIGELDAVLASRGARGVLKLHPMDALNESLTCSLRAISIVGRDFPDEPVEILLARSRCLVTDYSSVAIDYAVLDRPIGYFCPDRADYSRGFIEDVIPAFYGAGQMLDDIPALADFLANPQPSASADTSALASVRTPTASAAIWQHCENALRR